MQLEVARKSFIRVRDVRFIELISRIEKGLKRGEPEQLFRAEAYAYRGKFQEAAKAFKLKLVGLRRQWRCSQI